MAGLDSDGGYFCTIEFWRDGVRSCGFAEYDDWDSHYGTEGAMNTFEYGSLEYIKGLGTWHSSRVEASKFSPDRDYIKVSAYGIGSYCWPPKNETDDKENEDD